MNDQHQTLDALLVTTDLPHRGQAFKPLWDALHWARVEIQMSHDDDPVAALAELNAHLNTSRKVEEFFSAAPFSTGHAGIVASAAQLTTMKIVAADSGGTALNAHIADTHIPTAVFDWRRPSAHWVSMDADCYCRPPRR